MTNAELIACIQAEERGEVVEYRASQVDGALWVVKNKDGHWDSYEFDYRIRREPRKCWVKWNEDSPRIQEYDNSRYSDESWTSNGWQLVTEEIK